MEPQTITHPARRMTVSALTAALQEAVSNRLVSERVANDGRRLYCYTKTCVYDRAWSDVTMMARGLILDPAEDRIVATPFPKFFNLGERADPLPDIGFDVFEKLDGSLIVIHFHGGRWKTATKGSFDSAQALWAQDWLLRHDTSVLDRETTYLAEAIGPDNKIVIAYPEPALVLLAAFDRAGRELTPEELADIACAIGWRAARRHPYGSIAELVEMAGRLPASDEGFVLRYANGLRVKIKGDEYKRIHALISRVTPLAMWEALAADDNMDALRRELPEEFWGDFDSIVALLRGRTEALVRRVREVAEPLANLPDKDVGLMLSSLPADARHFVFPYRKGGGNLLVGRARVALFKELRPTGNNLPGYVPSYAMNRLEEEAA